MAWDVAWDLVRVSLVNFSSFEQQFFFGGDILFQQVQAVGHWDAWDGGGLQCDLGSILTPLPRSEKDSKLEEEGGYWVRDGRA